MWPWASLSFSMGLLILKVNLSHSFSSHTFLILCTKQSSVGESQEIDHILNNFHASVSFSITWAYNCVYLIGLLENDISQNLWSISCSTHSSAHKCQQLLVPDCNFTFSSFTVEIRNIIFTYEHSLSLYFWLIIEFTTWKMYDLGRIADKIFLFGCLLLFLALTSQ